MNISQVCEAAGISRETLYAWRYSKPGFSDMLARALERHYQTVGECLLDFSDRDVIAGDRSDSARVQLHRVRLETRRWLLERRLPDEYGNKLQVGGDIEFIMPDLRPKSVKDAEVTGSTPGKPEIATAKGSLPSRGSKP
jgi:hypothetical protein